MKNIFNPFVLFIILIFTACDKDSDNTLSHLSIENLKEFVPYDSLNIFSKVVFLNQDGDQKILTITKSIGQVEKTLDGKTYTVDQDEFTFRDETDTRYNIELLVTAHYSSSSSTIIEFVDCTLFTTVNNGFVPSVRLHTDKPPSRPNEVHTEVTLNGKIFQDVFSNHTIIEIGEKFSKLYYSKEIGVVGFKDGNGVLWVYDHYE